MKLPFIFSTSGGGNSYHDSSFESEDLDAENQDDISNENAEAIFEEYLWMENEEEFDKSELLRLEEEELIKDCLENCPNTEIIDNECVHWSTQNE